MKNLTMSVYFGIVISLIGFIAGSLNNELFGTYSYIFEEFLKLFAIFGVALVVGDSKYARFVPAFTFGLVEMIVYIYSSQYSTFESRLPALGIHAATGLIYMLPKKLVNLIYAFVLASLVHFVGNYVIILLAR